MQNSPQEARNMLLQNPQLAYALLQAQVVMRIVDPEIALVRDAALRTKRLAKSYMIMCLFEAKIIRSSRSDRCHSISSMYRKCSTVKLQSRL